MIDLNTINAFRDVSEACIKRFGHTGDATCGRFFFPTLMDRQICVLAANGEGWDHVSVSCRNRIPTWNEMSFVYRLFFKFDEVAYQLHVPEKDHINNNPNVLHLWRPHRGRIPLPPKSMV